MQLTRVNILNDISIKGGTDYPLQNDPFFQEQQAVGRQFIYSGRRLEKDTNMTQQSMDIHQFIPANGFTPVSIVSRGQNMLESSMRATRKDMTNMQIKKRARYTLDTSIDAKVDSMFQEFVRPRQTLLDSEAIALSQLKRAAGISRTLAQLPMVDYQSERIFKTLTAQADEMQLQRGGLGTQPQVPYQQQEYFAQGPPPPPPAAGPMPPPPRQQVGQPAPLATHVPARQQPPLLPQRDYVEDRAEAQNQSVLQPSSRSVDPLDVSQVPVTVPTGSGDTVPPPLVLPSERKLPPINETIELEDTKVDDAVVLDARGDLVTQDTIHVRDAGAFSKTEEEKTIDKMLPQYDLNPYDLGEPGQYGTNRPTPGSGAAADFDPSNNDTTINETMQLDDSIAQYVRDIEGVHAHAPTKIPVPPTGGSNSINQVDYLTSRRPDENFFDQSISTQLQSTAMQSQVNNMLRNEQSMATANSTMTGMNHNISNMVKSGKGAQNYSSQLLVQQNQQITKKMKQAMKNIARVDAEREVLNRSLNNAQGGGKKVLQQIDEGLYPGMDQTGSSSLNIA